MKENNVTISRLNTISDLSCSQILKVLEISEKLEEYKTENGYLPPALKGKCIALVFDETSLRTRNAFERGMLDLGGDAICFTGKEVRIGSKAEKQENLQDLINVMGGFNDLILTIIYDHELQTRISELSPVPFINGMCDKHHPTQALCDFLTIKRRLGRVENIKIAFVGDGTNVALSVAQVSELVGASFHIATPSEMQLPEECTRELSTYQWTSNPIEAVSDADVVIGDVWIPMNKLCEGDERRSILRPYQITADLMSAAKDHAFFMHNLPATRGEEVTEAVIDGARSAVYEEAVARLHIARALVLLMLHTDPNSYLDFLH